MKYLFKLAALTLLALSILQVSASITNTTGFWNSEFVPPQKLDYESYTGFEDVDWYFPKSSASIYYSLWQGYTLPWEDKTVPLIIWLQGGPGAPSQFGCFNLVGPLYIEGKNGSFKVTENPWSWNIHGHVMCIDQPMGVGFSYNNNTNRINNTRDSTNHLINFLSNFFANNPKLNLKDNPLYIAGESYAGHYIPALAERIKANS